MQVPDWLGPYGATAMAALLGSVARGKTWVGGDGRLMLVEKWQESRPKFVTSSEQEVALLRSQETLRKERDALFQGIQIRLDKLLDNQQEIRLELVKHTAGKP